jgi:GTP cyclohydrolase I
MGNLAATATVADIIGTMERLAPPHLAESWDNCGLHIGSRAWRVHRIRVALDPSVEVVEAAARDKVDLIITHHPLIFRPLKSIDVQTPVGRVIDIALQAKMSLYCAHTNLDSAREGVNDALARAIGIQDALPLVRAVTPDGLQADVGMGRVGRLSRAAKLEVLVERIKESIGLNYIKYSGDPDLGIDVAAVCSGSGSSLIPAFLATSAQVYISGDLRYHDAREIQACGRALSDIGHFHSERLVLDPLADRLKEAADTNKWEMDIQVCRLERDPFAVS